MKSLQRQKSASTTAREINIDFADASEEIARVFEPGIYILRINGATVINSEEGNTCILLQVSELESQARVDTRPIGLAWPNADEKRLAAENRHVIAQLLHLAEQPTSGNLAELLVKLLELEFTVRLSLATDNNTERTYNAIAAVDVGIAP